MPKMIDLSGQRFGRLSVVNHAGTAKDGRALWLCKCLCGNEKIVEGYKLRTGHTKSCGCWRNDCPKETKTTHGDGSRKGKRNRLYHIWGEIKYRCSDKETKMCKAYGARGIKMCDEWENSYVAFRDWALSSGYCDNLTIDRIDVNGNYCPDNCRWVGRKEQANNRRSNHYMTHDGQTHTLAEWEELTGIRQGTIKQRLNRGWPVERILTEPVKKAKER